MKFSSGAGTVLAVLLLVALQGLCEWGLRCLGWPLPASLVGLLLLWVGLLMLGRVPEALERVAALLLRHQMLFLIPSVAAIGSQWDALLPQAPALSLTLVVGTSFTVLVAGGALQWALRREGPPA